MMYTSDKNVGLKGETPLSDCKDVDTKGISDIHLMLNGSDSCKDVNSTSPFHINCKNPLDYRLKSKTQNADLRGNGVFVKDHDICFKNDSLLRNVSTDIGSVRSRFYDDNDFRDYARATIKEINTRDLRCTEGRNLSRLINAVKCEETLTERKGGLTWIRTGDDSQLPYIENTWLKHMIRILQSDKQALVSFFRNLEKCLYDAVVFLYNEGIKPYLGDVANQMKRSIADNFWSAAEVAYVSLHCRDVVELRIELRVKGEMGWVVYLLKDPPNFKGFVDTHSTVDVYSPYHWRALNRFAVELMSVSSSENSPAFSGGRYAFAERLKEKVEAFKNMRLGEVVHLVQLAIYSGVFVYAQRILLPVAACEKTAEELFPKPKKIRHPICSSMDEVLRIVSLLVDNRRNGLVLAQLKQQFMLQYNRELNPLSFGFRKLQNLLLSDAFSAYYNLFVPIDSPHRTHIQHKKYPIPPGCRIFKQSKLAFDPTKFSSPLDDWYDEPPTNFSVDSFPSNLKYTLSVVLDDYTQEYPHNNGIKCDA